jgi:integration host factor subunit beta
MNGVRFTRKNLSFYVKEYKWYTGRNPKTGETVEIAPKKLPYFKCGKGLRERVNA